MKRVSRAGLIFVVGFTGFVACSSIPKYQNEEHMKKIDEFDQQVQIVSADKADKQATQPGTETTEKKAMPEKKSRKKKKSKKPVVEAVVSKAPKRREPEIEPDAGFQGRRPLVDPYLVGEKLVYDVTYLGMTAGGLTMEVKPFVEVNGRKSYQYEMSAQSRSIFSSIYALDDKVINLVDFESLVPSVFTLHVKESSNLREARALFDRSKGQATYWEKKWTKDDGEKEKKQQWEIPDYSQNVFSALFYLRFFQWDVNSETAFRVADDEQNLIFTAKAIRKEKIKTDIGEFNTIVIKPEVQLRGVAKPMGDIFVWLSDDERKYVLRIEGKIKIGTLKINIVGLTPGK